MIEIEQTESETNDNDFRFYLKRDKRGRNDWWIPYIKYCITEMSKKYVFIVSIYLNRNSLTSSGIIELVQLLGKTNGPPLFLFVQNAICFCIACISDIRSDRLSFGLWILKFTNQSCNIWWRGSIRQVVIASLICSLQRSTMIKESPGSFSWLDICDWTRILWQAFSLRNIYNYFHYLS